MNISGISAANPQAVPLQTSQTDDAYSRNLRNQIANAQKQLQELSSNEDMPVEEKLKKRQELQKQISDLNAELRQHEIELKREKQQENADRVAENQSNSRTDDKESQKDTGLSKGSMQAMISADTSMKQAKVHDGVVTKLESRMRTLGSEIELDKSRNVNTGKKEEELSDLEQRVRKATDSELSDLSDANKVMKKAAEEGRETESEAKLQDEQEAENEAVSVQSEKELPDVKYISVDIRL